MTNFRRRTPGHMEEINHNLQQEMINYLSVQVTVITRGTDFLFLSNSRTTRQTDWSQTTTVFGGIIFKLKRTHLLSCINVLMPQFNRFCVRLYAYLCSEVAVLSHACDGNVNAIFFAPPLLRLRLLDFKRAMPL